MISLARLRNVVLRWRDLALRRTVMRSRPLVLQIELTNRCNLRCPACPRHSPGAPIDTGHMDFSLLDRIEDDMRHAFFVSIAGFGEPMLHPRFFELLERVAAAGAIPSIITNATLLDEAAARRLVAAGPAIFMPSIDAGTPALYEELREGARFERVRAGLLALRREKERAGTGFPMVHFAAVLSRKNEHDMERLAALAHETGAAHINLQTCYPYSEAAAAWRIGELERARQAARRLRQAAAAFGLPVTFFPLGFGLKERLAAEPSADVFIDESGAARRRSAPGPTVALYCPILWRQGQFSMDGRMRLCCFSEEEYLGSVMDARARHLWNAPAIVAMREAHLAGRIPPLCAGCYELEVWSAGADSPQRVALREIRQALSAPTAKKRKTP